MHDSDGLFKKGIKHDRLIEKNNIEVRDGV